MTLDGNNFNRSKGKKMSAGWKPHHAKQIPHFPNESKGPILRNGIKPERIAQSDNEPSNITEYDNIEESAENTETKIKLKVLPFRHCSEYRSASPSSRIGYKFEAIREFMRLWKAKRDFNQTQYLENSDDITDSSPLPWFDHLSGREYSERLVEFWDQAFQKCRNTIRQRAEIWPVGEHRCVFLWPERKSINWSMKNSLDLIQILYKNSRFYKNIFLTKKAKQIRIRNIDQDFEYQNRNQQEQPNIVCLLNCLIPNLVNSESAAIRRLGLQLLCRLGRRNMVCNSRRTHHRNRLNNFQQSVNEDTKLSSNVLFERIFPVLLDSLENSDDSIRCESLIHCCHLCQLIPWDTKTCTFIPVSQ